MDVAKLNESPRKPGYTPRAVRREAASFDVPRCAGSRASIRAARLAASVRGKSDDDERE
jgi:hypothetical protein